MKCKDCINFRTSSRMETSNELSPSINQLKGVCTINNSRCKSQDECRCGGFSQSELVQLKLNIDELGRNFISPAINII